MRAGGAGGKADTGGAMKGAVVAVSTGPGATGDGTPLFEAVVVLDWSHAASGSTTARLRARTDARPKRRCRMAMTCSV
jgi:hypothetical protein